MKEILIPLNFTATPVLYDSKQSFSASDESSGVLTFTTTANVTGTVASLTLRNASENANRQTILVERMDINSSPFSYAVKMPLPFGQYEGTVLLKKNLTVLASATFLFGVNSSLSAEVLPKLVEAYSLDALVESVETEVSVLKDAYSLTVSETVKGVNKTESTLQAQENVRYLNEHTRKNNNSLWKAQAEAFALAEENRVIEFNDLVDSAVIEQTVTQEVAEKYQEIEATQANRLLSVEQQLADIAINPNQFGLSENATWQVNRDAIQQANDLVAAQGGGTVLIPPGEYLVKGIIQDSRVTFDIKGSLVHPDGLLPNLISSRVFNITASTIKNSNVVTVSDAKNIEVGSLIAIRGARGISPLQNTLLTEAIDATQTTGIKLTSSSGFAQQGFLVVEDEVIQHTGIVSGELTGVTRGALGTTPTTHTINSIIGTAVRLVGEVVAVDGTSVTIDRNAVITVNNSTTSVGIVHPKVFGYLKGNKDKAVYRGVSAVSWGLVRFGEAKYTAEEFDAAMFMTRNTTDCDVDVKSINCSTKSQSIGACVWLFQGAFRNKVNLHATGDFWAAAYLDNRTSLGTEWDETIDHNYGHILAKSDSFANSVTTTGLLVVGGNNNTFTVTTVNVHTAVKITNIDQAYAQDGSLPDSKGNKIDLRMSGGYKPYIVYSPGNTLSGYYDSHLNGDIYAGNLITAYSPSSGENPVLGQFHDGTYLKPAMTFASDPSTGFYKISNGQMQFVSQGDLVARFIKEGILFANGKNLSFVNSKIGSSKLDKMGFWGATPIVKPTGTPSAANDLASALTLVNFLRTALQNAGIVDIQ